MPAPPEPAATHAPWRVERARPTDRGLVARLVEAVVAADPAVAPPVADGTLRAAQWLQQERPAWEGVAVLGAEPRRVVGYVAAPAGPRAAAPRVLLHPDHGDPALRDELVAAARRGLAEARRRPAVPAPLPLPLPADRPAISAAPPAPPGRRRLRDRLTEPVGAVAILAGGTAAVLAVQVGAGPLSDVVPFLRPDREGPAAAAEPSPGPRPAPPTPTELPRAVAPTPAAGPAGAPTTGEATPTPPPATTAPPAPAAPSVDPPAPAGPPPPRQTPEPTSALVDPLVTGVLGAVDGATGGALAPVTATVGGLAGTTTDVLDGLLGLLVPPR